MEAKKKTKEKYIPRLKEKYHKEIVSRYVKKHSLKNLMQVPRIEKIVVNIGLGEAVQNPKTLEAATKDLTTITGQKPLITRAKKSIAGFKVRSGVPLGCKVTLRRDRMYDFLDRFMSIVVPRMRDFRGFSRNSFDGHGNYSVGVEEQLVFPEINYDEIDQIRGMDITIVTSADNDTESCSLLEEFGFPFRPAKKKVGQG